MAHKILPKPAFLFSMAGQFSNIYNPPIFQHKFTVLQNAASISEPSIFCMIILLFHKCGVPLPHMSVMKKTHARTWRFANKLTSLIYLQLS